MIRLKAKTLPILTLVALLCNTLPGLAATCSAGANCTACKNCSACGHCAKRGGTCSVCRPDLYRTVARPAPRIQTTAPEYPTPPVYAPRPAATPRPRVQRVRVTVPAQFVAKCIGVSDGDTITVHYQGRYPVKVRLYGIDAPEKAQAFGNQAKKYISSLAFGKPVTIYSKGKDRYGRVLGWAFVGKTCVNTELVKAGLAWHYRQYAPRESKLAELETSARAAHSGLWSQPNPIAPWDWRRGVQHATVAPPAPLAEEKAVEEKAPVALPPTMPPALPPLEKPPANKPDLIISKVLFKPEQPKVGELIQAIIYYKNIGDKPAQKFYLGSPASELGQGGLGLGGDFAHLEPGEVKSYQCCLRHSSRSLPLKDSMNGLSVGLAGLLKSSFTPFLWTQSSTTQLINSEPLSQ